MPYTGQYRTDYAQSVLALLNQQRANGGLGAVSIDASLQAAAEYYARFHFLNADPFQLSHYLDGGPGDRAWSRGYCCAVGEILATTQGGPEGMVALWMGSPPHASIIMDGAYDHIGVACFQGPYVTSAGDTIQPVLCAAEFGNSNP